MEVLVRRTGGLPASLETLKIGKTLGKGGFAVVKSGTLKADDGGSLQVAVKVLHPEYSDEYSQELRLFREEAELVLQLDHSNIITAYGLLKLPTNFPGLDGNHTRPAYALVLELMEGGSLAGLMIKQLVAGPTPKYTFSQALVWSIDVARALQYLHTGGRDGFPRLHRDVKLENVLLTTGMRTAKLADFGLQRAIASEQDKSVMMVRRCTRPTPAAPAPVRTGPAGPSRLAPDAEPATAPRTGQVPPLGTSAPADAVATAASTSQPRASGEAQHPGSLFFHVSHKGMTPLVLPGTPRSPGEAPAAQAGGSATPEKGLDRLREDLEVEMTRRSASMSQLERPQPGNQQHGAQHPMAATAPGEQVTAGPRCATQTSCNAPAPLAGRPGLPAGGRGTPATQLRGRGATGTGLVGSRPSPLGQPVARVRQDSYSDASPRLSTRSLSRLGAGGPGPGSAVPMVSVTGRGPTAGGALLRGSSFGVGQSFGVSSPRGQAGGEAAGCALTVAVASAGADAASREPSPPDSVGGDVQLASPPAAAVAAAARASGPVSCIVDGRPSTASTRDVVMLGEMLFLPQDGRVSSPSAGCAPLSAPALAARPPSSRRSQAASSLGGGAVACISDRPPQLRLMLPDVTSGDQGSVALGDFNEAAVLLPGSARRVGSQSSSEPADTEDPMIEAMKSVAAWREESWASEAANPPADEAVGGTEPGAGPENGSKARRQVSMPEGNSISAAPLAQFTRNSGNAAVDGGGAGAGGEMCMSAPLQTADVLHMRVAALNGGVRSVRNSGTGMISSRGPINQRLAAVAAAVRAAGGGGVVAGGGGPGGVRSSGAGMKKPQTAEYEEVFSLTGRTGSLIYLAPEAYKNEPYNDKVDVYSLGVMMYELFGRTSLTYTHISTKLPAFSRMIHDTNEFAERVAAGYRPPRTKQMAKLPPGLWELIEASWHQDPVQRPDIDYVVEALEHLVEPMAAAEAHQGVACACVIS